MKVSIVSLAPVILLLGLCSSVMAKDTYFKLTCEKGTRLEQKGDKLQFRCAKRGEKVTEHRAGRCKRPSVLRRVKGWGFTYGCIGTTISRQGDVGSTESWAMYDCPAEYRPNPVARKSRETCHRKVEGTLYTQPTFKD